MAKEKINEPAIDDAIAKAYLAAIVESSSDAIISKNLDGIITSWNAAAESIFGYTSSEAIGKHIELIIPKDRLDEEFKIISQIKAGKRIDHFETVRQAKDGRPVDISITVSPIRDGSGKIIGASKVARDIGEKKKAESLLQKAYDEMEERVKERTVEIENQQAFLQAILEHITDGIVACDAEGNLSLFNKATKKLHGLPDEPLPPESWAEHYSLYRPDDQGLMPKEEIPLYRALHGEYVEDQEMMIKVKGEDPKILRASGQAIYNDKGAKIGAVVSMHDVTEQRKIQDELVKHRDNLQELVTLQTKDLRLSKENAEAANRTRSDFLTNMSHEIRTPINVIIGLSNILSQSKPLTPQQQEFLKTLQSSADTLLALINDFLDISKIEAQTVSVETIPFDMESLIDDIATMMSIKAKEKNLYLKFESRAGGDRYFAGDPHRLKQILLNLCSNAIKFTDKGGVTIRLSSARGDAPHKRMVRFEVKDTGIGVPEDKKEQIFEKFVQADTSINRKYGGTGLGLAITKSLTNIMGGTIIVESDGKTGTTFIVAIPMEIREEADIESGLKKSKSEQVIVAHKEQKILLVDDYAPNIQVAEYLIRQFGYECEIADSGNAAIEKFKAGDYAMILMDVQMQGTDGLEATKQIRAFETKTNRGRTPIIGMSAHARPEDREQALSAGMNDYLVKPYTMEDLKTKIVGFIERL